MFNSAYSLKPRVLTEAGGLSMTKQSFKAECDINNILKRFRKNAGIDFLNTYSGYLSGKFEDVSAAVDYHTAHAQIDEARQVFGAMPASLRARFNNDPGALLDFLGNSANREEAVSLGLLVKPPVVSGQPRGEPVS